MAGPIDWIEPDWPAPPRVRTLITTRNGGVSRGPYATLNLGTRVGDDPRAVTENRARLRSLLPSEPKWLRQVHGIEAVQADRVEGEPAADAAFTHVPGVVCVVQAADCLPVLLCDRNGNGIAGAHAGWRGLNAGVLERTVAALKLPPKDLLAWLGPAIGPNAFEVGADVFDPFTAVDRDACAAFQPLREGKWLADLYALARRRLSQIGVAAVYGGPLCTAGDPARFFSHRRDGVTGRQAALIWLAD